MDINEMDFDIGVDVSIYEIDNDNDFNIDDATDEEKSTILELNKKFLINELKPSLISRVTTCQCQINQKREANERLRQSLGLSKEEFIPEDITEEDVANYQFSVLIISNAGKYSQVSAMIRQCKRCGKIELWGSADILMTILSSKIVDMMNEEAEMANSVIDNSIIKDRSSESIEIDDSIILEEEVKE